MQSGLMTRWLDLDRVSANVEQSVRFPTTSSGCGHSDPRTPLGDTIRIVPSFG